MKYSVLFVGYLVLGTVLAISFVASQMTVDLDYTKQCSNNCRELEISVDTLRKMVSSQQEFLRRSGWSSESTNTLKQLQIDAKEEGKRRNESALSMSSALQALQSSLQTTNRVLQQAKSDFSDSKRTLRSEMDSLRDELSAVRNENNKTREDYLELNSTVRIIKEDLNSLMSRMGKVDSILDNHGQSIEELRQSVLDLAKAVLMKADGSVNSSLSFISNVTGRLNTSFEKPEELTCREDFERFADSCYIISNPIRDLHWKNAENNCKQKDADLVAIETIEEMVYLRNKIKGINKASRTSGNNWWTSGRDDDRDGVWRWKSTGKPINDSYVRWSPGEPNQLTRSTATCLGLYRPHYYYNDVLCDITGYSEHHGYICEYHLLDNDNL